MNLQWSLWKRSQLFLIISEQKGWPLTDMIPPKECDINASLIKSVSGRPPDVNIIGSVKISSTHIIQASHNDSLEACFSTTSSTLTSEMCHRKISHPENNYGEQKPLLLNNKSRDNFKIFSWELQQRLISLRALIIVIYCSAFDVIMIARLQL